MRRTTLWYGSLVVAEKNMRIYYLKAPVLIFGIILPFFLCLAFVMGRDISLSSFVPGVVGMTLFFTSSSVGPLVTPWERNARTYERLLSTPLSLSAILLGDVISGFIYGLAISFLPVVLGVTIFGCGLDNVSLLLGGIVVGAFSFAALGVLLSAPHTGAPSHIMMLSALIRFPIVFLSGVFVPLEKMGQTGRMIALFSPLTYVVDIMREAFHGGSYYPLGMDFLLVVAYFFGLFYVALHLHRRGLTKSF
ncbi:ABC transporter [candidate division TA06 bacterium DG_26]|uniref:Transport permease protein n=1 Tax=candidate division TA06 bacterium DG_26 TaxID=1703771 RepID=A0A0S7WKH9_UNCT6|nr:MAG: ABC transporter [candidate division TA06 bacterium DG_26]